jgi:hypothetical protein
MTGLSNTQQAILMFAGFALAPIGAWLGLGAPLDHASIALMLSGLVGGAIAFAKEMLGGQAPVTTALPPLGAQIGELADGTPVYGPAPKAVV